MDTVPPRRLFQVVRTDPGVSLDEARLDAVASYGDFQGFLVEEIVRHSWQFLQGDPMRILDQIFAAAAKWFEQSDFVRFLEVFDVWKEHLKEAVQMWIHEEDDWPLLMRLEETRSIRIRPVRSASQWVWEV